MSVVIIYPHHDIPTTLSALCADELVEWIKREMRVKPTELYGFGAVRLALYSKLLQPANLICYYGHGGSNRLHGQTPPDELILPDNVDWFSDKIVFTYACLSARQLAPLGIRKGVKAYFGSVSDMYVAFPEWDHDYLADWVDCINTIPKALLLGRTCGEAFELFESKVEHYVSLYEERKAEWLNADWYAWAFRHNLNHYRLLGNPDLSLQEVPPTVIQVPKVPEINPLAEFMKFISGLGVVTTALVVGAPMLYEHGKRHKWW